MSGPNFWQVTPYLYKGPDPKIHEIYILREKGIRTIISLRTNSQKRKQELCEQLGLRWIEIKTGVFLPLTPEQLDLRGKRKRDCLSRLMKHCVRTCGHGRTMLQASANFWQCLFGGKLASENRLLKISGAI
jgi:hypothetical protein